MNEFVALNYLPFSFSCPFPAIIKELEMKYSSLKHVWDDIFSWYYLWRIECYKISPTLSNVGPYQFKFGLKSNQNEHSSQNDRFVTI